MKEVITYYRCSTKDKQRYSLEAQRLVVEQFCKTHNLQIVGSYEEQLSGKSLNRPELQKALQHSNKANIPIVILRLDRLGRNASEMIDLAINNNIIITEYGIHQFDRLAINIMASFAERERELISKRTKEGLRVAKSKGVVLGNPNIEKIRIKAAKKIQEGADNFATDLQNLFADFSHLNNRQMANKLNRWGIPTRNGGKWFPETVRRVRNRLSSKES